jgi:hypothetical protein
MSDIPTDYLDRLNLAELVARIERQQRETHKFIAEHDKLAAEARKFTAEHDKLSAEGRKFDRDRWLAPWLAIAGILGGLATIGVSIARALHWLP